MTETIKTEFSVLETKLLNKIEKSITAKTTKDQETPTKSYAEMAKTNNNLNITNIKRLLRSEKVEEQIEEQRKQSRDANIIIHGVKETENKDDKDFVAELLSDVNINTEPTYVSRIGKESGMRPIKVVFKDTHFKYRFMKQLRELKQHRKYDKVSITDDLTKLEREQVKEWRKRASEINQAMSEKDHVLRVRGSPRDKLYFKKVFCKRSV